MKIVTAKNFKNILSAAMLGFITLLSFPALGNTVVRADYCDDLKQQIGNAGFDVEGQLPAYCTTGSLYSKFLNYALFFVGIVAVIMIIYGGYLYMTARNNEGQRKKGREILNWAVIGLAVVILATIIVNVVVNMFTA